MPFLHSIFLVLQVKPVLLFPSGVTQIRIELSLVKRVRKILIFRKRDPVALPYCLKVGIYNNVILAHA